MRIPIAASVQTPAYDGIVGPLNGPPEARLEQRRLEFGKWSLKPRENRNRGAIEGSNRKSHWSCCGECERVKWALHQIPMSLVGVSEAGWTHRGLGVSSLCELRVLR